MNAEDLEYRILERLKGYRAGLSVPPVWIAEDLDITWNEAKCALEELYKQGKIKRWEKISRYWV